MLHQAVPLLGLLVQGAVLPVGHQLDLVFKAELLCDAVDQVQRVAFVLGVALEPFAVLGFTRGGEGRGETVTVIGQLVEQIVWVVFDSTPKQFPVLQEGQPQRVPPPGTTHKLLLGLVNFGQIEGIATPNAGAAVRH